MIRVLVAEDHTIVREGIKQLIGMARDLQVVGEASNGEQLLETLRSTPCEVVLLDISMPGVNGLEAIPRIRALSQPPARNSSVLPSARTASLGPAFIRWMGLSPAMYRPAIMPACPDTPPPPHPAGRHTRRRLCRSR